MSDRQWSRRTQDEADGWGEFPGFGWIKDLPPEIQLVVPRVTPSESFESLNRQDLERLLDESKVHVFVEDEDQPALSEGVTTEWDLITKLNRRRLNIRICHEYDRVYERTVFPFSETLTANGVIAVRLTDNSTFEVLDLNLVVCVLTMWVLDTPGAQTPAYLKVQALRDLDVSRVLIPLDEQRRELLSDCVQLVQCAEPRVRRALLLHIAGCRDIGLRLDLSRSLGQLFITLGRRHAYVDDYYRFMEFMPDIDWTETRQRMT
jgi:hypothetical protein